MEDEKPEVYDKRTHIANEYGLSGREMEIAALLYQKLSYEMIGEKLFISRYTVKRHVHNIYEKMGVTRRDDFIRILDGEKISSAESSSPHSCKLTAYENRRIP